jgi:hypothetical protein
MKHYHLLNSNGKTIGLRKNVSIWTLLFKRKTFKVCILPFSYLDKNRHWKGDAYNPNGMCIKA